METKMVAIVIKKGEDKEKKMEKKKNEINCESNCLLEFTSQMDRDRDTGQILNRSL